MSDTPIEWRPGHPGSQNRHGWVPGESGGEWLVARVLYRGVGGPNDGPWWEARVGDDRVPGQYATRDEACRAAEQAYANRPT